jgi:hypothetical protein
MIGFKPESRDELRERLKEMSELELRRFGQQARKLCDPKMNFGSTEPYVVQLEEARTEWRRRHPAREGPSRSRISNLVARKSTSGLGRP